MDSNHRPRAYQARALATWATDRFTQRLIRFVPLRYVDHSFPSPFFNHLIGEEWDSNLILERGSRDRFRLTIIDAIFRSQVRSTLDRKMVEMMGFEPMTPCLQGRCSPNWATPPFLWVCSLRLRLKPDNWTTDSIRTHEYTSLSRFLPNSTTSAQLNFCYVSLTVSIERRWSSRTFRYGYLVTT